MLKFGILFSLTTGITHSRGSALPTRRLLVSGSPMTIDLTLVITDVPNFDDQEALEGQPYTGARIVRCGFLRNILEYGGLKRIVLVTVRSKLDSVIAQMAALKKNCDIKTVLAQDVSNATVGEKLVFHSLNASLNRGLHLRRICGASNSPVIGMTHDLSDPQIFGDLVLAHGAGLQEGDAMFCCSEAARCTMEAMTDQAHRLTQISNPRLALPLAPYGVDLDEQVVHDKTVSRNALQIPLKAFVFLFFGRLSGSSKADLKALILAYSRGGFPADTILIIAGGVTSALDEIYFAELKSLVFQVGFQKRVRFICNPTPGEKQFIYSAADVFISPANSLQESFGITLIEAMLHSLPVIATDWNGYRDIVRHDKTGFLIPTAFSAQADIEYLYTAFEDDVDRSRLLSNNVMIDHDRLIATMTRLREDNTLRVEVGRCGYREAMDRFTWKAALPSHYEGWRVLSARANSQPYKLRDVSPFLDYKKAFKRHASGIGIN
jgi:D-inositol-3-phosphate glycosyltransferase